MFDQFWYGIETSQHQFQKPRVRFVHGAEAEPLEFRGTRIGISLAQRETGGSTIDQSVYQGCNATGPGFARHQGCLKRSKELPIDRSVRGLIGCENSLELSGNQFPVATGFTQFLLPVIPG